MLTVSDPEEVVTLSTFGLPKELVVAAAANLTEAFGEIGFRFTAQTGIRVVFSFGATAELAKQIENGAPFDVFAAADTEHVDSLDRAGGYVFARRMQAERQAEN